MELRKRLDKIIQSDNGENWWKPDLFQEKTLKLIPAELEIISNPPPKEKNYNCFIYILNLSEDAEIIEDSGGFIYDTFFQVLIDEKVLTHTNHPQNGDYILYRDPKNYSDMITHSGILDNEKVVSKWAWGPLIRHAIWDIPASYGNNISYVKAIKSREARDLYWKYKKFNKLP